MISTAHRPPSRAICAALVAAYVLLLAASPLPAQEWRAGRPGPRLVPVQTQRPIDRPTVLQAEIWSASWCPPCRDYRPIAEAVRRQGYDVRFVDYDQHRQVAAQIGITTLPTTVILDGERRIVQRLVGVQSVTALRAALEGSQQRAAYPSGCHGTLPGAPFRSQPQRQPQTYTPPPAPQPKPQPDPRVDQVIGRLQQIEQQMQQSTIDMPTLIQEVLAAQPPIYVQIIDPTGQFSTEPMAVYPGDTMRLVYDPSRLQEIEKDAK